MNATQEIQSGSFAVPRWTLFPPDSVKVVSWNIDRGLKLHNVIDFLAAAKADIILLQEVDVNCRRTHHINVGEGNRSEAGDELRFRSGVSGADTGI